MESHSLFNSCIVLENRTEARERETQGVALLAALAFAGKTERRIETQVPLSEEISSLARFFSARQGGDSYL